MGKPEKSQGDQEVFSPYPTSLGLSCPLTSEEPSRTGPCMCEEGKTNKAISDGACCCLGGLKTGRETKSSALWWLVTSFKAGDTIFALKYGELAS